jgi:hypothetical protein
MGRNARQHPSRRSGPLSMRAIVLGGVLVSCVEAAAATALLYFYGGGTDRDLDLPWRSSRVVVLLSARVSARKARPINVAEVMDSRMSQNSLVWSLENGTRPPHLPVPGASQLWGHPRRGSSRARSTALMVSHELSCNRQLDPCGLSTARENPRARHPILTPCAARSPLPFSRDADREPGLA